MYSESTIRLLRAISRLFGWIYTLAWSLSFYPQPLLNMRRHSTAGSSPSFPFLNIIGFLSYLVSNTLLFYAPAIRAQYAARHGGKTPTVRGNDVVFAAHALAMSLLVASMFWGGRACWGIQGPRGRVEGWVRGVGIGCLVGVGTVAGAVQARGTGSPTGWAGIDVVYAFGYAKLVITVVKYVPQAWTNYERRSTSGWSIGQILLDLVGGVLSIGQLLIDSSLQGDWSGVTGNPVKLGLGNVSILFDLVFIIQHYWLYRGATTSKAEAEPEGERRRLLSQDGEA